MSIFSRLHMLADFININRDGKKLREDPAVARMLDIPTFCIDTDAIQLLQRSDLLASVKAIWEAELTHLPYPRMVVEFHEHGEFHELIYLEEDRVNNRIKSRWCFLDPVKRVGGIGRKDIIVEVTEKGFIFDVSDHYQESSSEKVAVLSTTIALHSAYLLMNMKGIDREVIISDKVNKKRIAKRETKIANYTILRIGKVYRQDGTHVRYETGRHMPVHWRSGYTRLQHFGKGREETKRVYIEPCLVNFDPSSKQPMPTPKPKVIKA